MAEHTGQFQTIRTEGAILPPDILRRIAAEDVDGMTPEAYHLPPGTKPRESIAQAWAALKGHWKAFQEARANLPESDLSGTAVTNERWLLPLFKELDYGRLVTSKSPEIDERVYPIERSYKYTPIHLIGCKLPLDRRTQGARGAATASPHSMVQEFLNRSSDHLWAFLSNGLQLRVLRDNVSLSRQAYVEFDLEAMMEGEVYADFALLWLLCHQSRIESENAVDCWLEKWSKLAREQGTRILNDLRVGVQKAIEALGRGFIGHPRNDRLREKLHTESLSTDEFYRQLLRIVYRLLFLFVAEDRELLHPPDASVDACHLYDAHYSMRRLRELAHKIRGSKHADLWHSMSLVFAALGKNEGCPELGLCGLGSFLWRSISTADVVGPLQGNGEAVFITNDDLLQAVRALAYVEQDRVLRTVDYRNLGSEELGSVYESLLELHPVMNAEAKAFELSTAAGNERKTTGSYYTPDSLVQCLLDSALDPVVEVRLKGKKGYEAEEALLGIKVCDPASGSGHFLIAAAHRLARHLARARTGEAEPSPHDYQHALRDVIGRCLYGVDINPMAVELCKVSLWMEAIEPGKPLSFLDHHIQCGNSLLGTTPAVLAKGIPDDAFQAIEGDVKERVSALKKDNKRERQDYKSGQGYLFSPPLNLGNLPATLAKLTKADDNTLSDVSAKEGLYVELVKGADYRNARLLADTWCAAFVWKKDESDLGRLCPTERAFRSIEDNPQSVNIHVKAEVERLSGEYQFFHWHLAYPDVFQLPEDVDLAGNPTTSWNGGFDVVLGNPPWEHVELKEKEWFEERAPDIANARTGAQRKKMIADLASSDPHLFAMFCDARRHHNGIGFFLGSSGVYPLCGRGRINVYTIFTELSRNLVNRDGRTGLVVQSGIATDDTTKLFFQDLIERNSLVSLFDFENREKLFPAVDGRMKFSLITMAAPTAETRAAAFSFFCHAPSDTQVPSKRFSLTAQDIALLNPNTRTCPIFRSRHDAELTKYVSRRLPSIKREASDNPWSVTIRRLFNMGLEDVSGRAVPVVSAEASDGELVPMLEGKMIDMFNHRASSVVFNEANIHRGAQSEATTTRELSDPCFSARPLYLYPREELAPYFALNEGRKWLLGYKDIGSTTNERTSIASILPLAATNFTIRIAFLTGHAPTYIASYCGAMCSFAYDFIVRQFLGGNHLSDYVIHQTPMMRPTDLDVSRFARQPIRLWLCSRVLELTYTSLDVKAFATDCGYEGPPFRWNDDRRIVLRCELDAAYFHLYLGAEADWNSGHSALVEMFPTPRHAVEYIMETFPIVKRKDEQAHVEYRTKRVILEIYDEMTEAIRTGQPYHTRLDPPPGPPTDAEGNFIPMAEWDPTNWPSHIHQPRRKSEFAS